MLNLAKNWNSRFLKGKIVKYAEILNSGVSKRKILTPGKNLEFKILER